MLDQLEDVVASLAQWRNRERNYLQPEVQILAKRSGAHRTLKVVVRRRNDPHVGANDFVPADSLDLLCFDRAEQLGLRIGPKIADFIKE